MKIGFSLVLIVFLTLVCVASNPANPANAAVTMFAQMSNPNGVAIDQQGNVYVQSLAVGYGGGLYKFSPDGHLLARNPNLFGKFRMVGDTINNVIWALETCGVLYRVDPNTLHAQPFLNIRNLPIPQEPVNILTGERVDLLMVDPQYGDIALRRIDPDQFDLFITGMTSAGGVPFVVRLRFQQTIEPAILVASVPWPNPIIQPPLDTQASGIAVNADGKVLTVLPGSISGGTTPFFLVSFDADFPETNIGRPSFVPAFYGRQVCSIGMTDSSTNKGFYVVATAQGFGCGPGLVVLHATESLDSVTCVADLSSFGLSNLTPPDDVAVGPDNRYLYVTMSAKNLVVRVDISANNSAVNNCAAILSNNLSLHVPIINFNGGQAYFWADFSYIPNTYDFNLANYKAISDISPFRDCTPSTLSTDLKLHIPSMTFGGASYWLDFQYAHDSIFTLTGIGKN